MARSSLGCPGLLPVWNDRRKTMRKNHAAGHQDKGGKGADLPAGEYARAGVGEGEGARHRDGERGMKTHQLSSPHKPPPEALGILEGSENGVRYALSARHRGIDPWLFLDMRAARKWILDNSMGLQVLNLFSYTGGVGVAAAKGGASLVWNVDFAGSGHVAGRASLALNSEAGVVAGTGDGAKEGQGQGVISGAGTGAGTAGCDCRWIKADVRKDWQWGDSI
ncbi:unnamed protein product [Discosporangium mesarthrocarpum]